MAVLSASTPAPSATSPVCTPTRTAKSLMSCRRCAASACSRPDARMARPARTARSASSSRASSVPKVAFKPSPVKHSTRPWWACTMSAMRRRAPLRSARVTSASMPWARAVESTTSANNTVTCRCCKPAGRSRLASRARSGAMASSSTVSPSVARWACSAAMAVRQDSMSASCIFRSPPRAAADPVLPPCARNLCRRLPVPGCLGSRPCAARQQSQAPAHRPPWPAGAHQPAGI